MLCSLSEFRVDEEGLWTETAETLVVLLDLSDPAAPKESGRTTLSGTLLEAGLFGEALCVVSEKSVWTLPETGTEALLPWFEEDGKRTSLRPADVYLPEAPMQAALTLVSVLRLEDGRVLDALALADAAEAALIEGDSLWLARSCWTETRTEPDRERERPYTCVSYEQQANTELLRLRYDGSLRLEGAPFVERIHRLVSEASKAGRRPVIFGSRTHPEVVGISGWCDEPLVVESPEEFETWLREDPKRRDLPLTLVAQTTSNQNLWKKFEEIIKFLCTNAEKFDTICKATENRQTAAAALAARSDAMLVVGDRTSSNTRQLAAICETHCGRVWLVDNAAELADCDFSGIHTIGITAGASTPAWSPFSLLGERIAL